MTTPEMLAGVNPTQFEQKRRAIPEISLWQDAMTGVTQARGRGSHIIYGVESSTAANILAEDIKNWGEFHYSLKVREIDCIPTDESDVRKEVNSLNLFFDEYGKQGLVVIRSLDRLVGGNEERPTAGQLRAAKTITEFLQSERPTPICALTTARIEEGSQDTKRVPRLIGQFASHSVFSGQAEEWAITRPEEIVEPTSETIAEQMHPEANQALQKQLVVA